MGKPCLKALWNIVGGLSLGWASVLSAAPCSSENFLVGAAREDITGPIAEVGMMGYADLAQIDEGLHMRLWSRALVVADSCGGRPVALVVQDLGQVFGGLKEAIVLELNRQLPGVFARDQVLLTATHTHSGPGGYAHHALYNITTYGFSPLNFQTIVDGTVRSIVKAYERRELSQLSLHRGELRGVQFNRSPEAYAKNPAVERSLYADNTDPEMLLLKAVSEGGQDLAAFNWYAIHGVSIPMENRLVSGDNKGLAAYLMEKDFTRGNTPFVAGFAQANSGDISPYAIPETRKPSEAEYFARNQEAAERQYEKARELYKAARDIVRGPVQAVQKYVDLSNRAVSEVYTDGAGPQETCRAALGVSFAAGTENGQPIGLFKEGTIWGVNWKKITLMPNEQKCHQEKVILLPTGFVKPDPWTAEIVPFQLIRIGSLAILGAPFEATTMAGRRLKQAVADSLAAEGVRYVAISALANEYIHYVTTREEYSQQAYEGGSTLYGPWSLSAFTQIYAELADDIKAGRLAEDEAQPPDLSKKQLSLNPGVIFDSVPRGKNFGDLVETPAAAYRAGEEVRVVFWGAHPNNSIGRDASLLSVERLEGNRWQEVRSDNDPDTFYRWKRDGLANSRIEVRWQVPVAEAGGTYRVCHRGHSKAFLSGEFSPYEGCSQGFLVESVAFH